MQARVYLTSHRPVVGGHLLSVVFDLVVTVSFSPRQPASRRHHRLTVDGVDLNLERTRIFDERWRNES